MRGYSTFTQAMFKTRWGRAPIVTPAAHALLAVTGTRSPPGRSMKAVAAEAAGPSAQAFSKKNMGHGGRGGCRSSWAETGQRWPSLWSSPMGRDPRRAARAHTLCKVTGPIGFRISDESLIGSGVVSVLRGGKHRLQPLNDRNIERQKAQSVEIRKREFHFLSEENRTDRVEPAGFLVRSGVDGMGHHLVRISRPTYRGRGRDENASTSSSRHIPNIASMDGRRSADRLAGRASRDSR